MNIASLILAAGKGTRMKSKLPKVLHKVGAKELNFCVRYGNRCALLAIITRPLKDVVNLPKLDIFFSFFG